MKERIVNNEARENVSSLDFFRKFKKVLQPLLAASFLFGASPVGAKESPRLDDSSVATSTLVEGEEFHQDSDREWEMPDVRITFIRDGVLDPLALLAPLQIELPSTVKERIQKEFSVQNVYGESFQKNDPVNPSDYEEMARRLNESLTQVVGEELIGLDFNKRVYEESAEERQGPSSKIVGIEISPSASFEGPASKGPDTLRPGNIDPENIKLAESRGVKAGQLINRYLAESGLEEGANVSYQSAVEAQLGDEEFEDLVELSKNYPGRNDFEKIFNLIRDYNDGKVSDPETLKALDSIVASKRNVGILITYEKDSKRVIFIPIPIFLLFALMLLKRKPKDYGLGEEQSQSSSAEASDVEVEKVDSGQKKIKSGRYISRTKPWARVGERGRINPKGQTRGFRNPQRALGTNSPKGMGRGPHRSGAGRRTDRMV